MARYRVRNLRVLSRAARRSRAIYPFNVRRIRTIYFRAMNRTPVLHLCCPALPALHGATKIRAFALERLRD